MDQDVEIPAGLIKLETTETLQGYVLVVPGSPEHRQYAPPADEPPATPKKTP